MPDSRLAYAKYVSAFNTPAFAVLRVLGAVRCGSPACLRSPVPASDERFHDVYLAVPTDPEKVNDSAPLSDRRAPK